eukprot:1137263-Pelagomonas_calceolata.AAC.2
MECMHLDWAPWVAAGCCGLLVVAIAALMRYLYQRAARAEACIAALQLTETEASLRPLGPGKAHVCKLPGPVHMRDRSADCRALHQVQRLLRAAQTRFLLGKDARQKDNQASAITKSSMSVHSIRASYLELLTLKEQQKRN